LPSWLQRVRFSREGFGAAASNAPADSSLHLTAGRASFILDLAKLSREVDPGVMRSQQVTTRDSLLVWLPPAIYRAVQSEARARAVSPSRIVEEALQLRAPRELNADPLPAGGAL
jgi:hypothetical protein